MPTLSWRSSLGGRLLALALPITLQTLLFSSKGLIDNMMLVHLGETQIAAAGIATRILFVVMIFLSGLAMGGGQIAAQHYGAVQAGRADVGRLPRLIAQSWLLQLLFTLPLVALFLLWPETLLRWISSDAQVLHEGTLFLQIIAPSLLLLNFTSVLASGLRAMQQPQIATWFSAAGVLANIGLNYLLIFGNAGFPALGVAGAAWGTALAGLLETTLLACYLLRKRHLLARLPLWAVLRNWRADAAALRRQVALSLQLAANSTLWALGALVFFALVGGNDASTLAALAILSPIESWSLSLLIGLSCAASILVGASIGANQLARARQEGWHILALALGLGLFSAVLIWLARPLILALFPALPADVADRLEPLFALMAISFIGKSGVMMLLAGVLRGGGDNTFCFGLDVIVQWGLILPLAWWLATVAGWPAPWLYALLLLEEAIKLLVAIMRLASGRWQHQLLAA